MVVGSLDSWLATAMSQPGMPIPKHKPKQVFGTAAAWAGPDSPSSSSSDTGACTPFRSHTVCPVPRLSLLTAQLRDSCGSPSGAGCYTVLGSVDGPVRGGDCVFLPRAVSQPEFHQGNTAGLLACNSLSSPYERGGTVRGGCRLSDEAKESNSGRRCMLPTASACRAATSSRLVRSITLNVELSTIAESGSSAAPHLPPPCSSNMEAQAGDMAPALLHAAAGQPPRRRGLFDGTVRGGQPRKAGWCSGQSRSEAGWVSRQGVSSATVSTAASAASEPLEPRALRPLPWSQPQSLGDMLRFALQRP